MHLHIWKFPSLSLETENKLLIMILIELFLSSMTNKQGTRISNNFFSDVVGMKETQFFKISKLYEFG